MYGHCPNPQPKGPHLARRRRYNHYLTCLRCHGRYSVLARDVRCCRCIDLGCTGCARAQARPGGRRRARGSLRSGRRSLARHDATGGQRLHPQPADGTPAFHCHGSHHLYFPGNRRQTRKTHSPARHHLGRHLRRHWSRQGAGLRLCAGGVHHDGLFHRGGRRHVARRLYGRGSGHFPTY